MWSDTKSAEIEFFLGDLMWMGLFRLPTISDYWSRNTIYSNKMTRHHSELLLHLIHFNNNKNTEQADQLHKLAQLKKKLRDAS
jgi:hypothetical protein